MGAEILTFGHTEIEKNRFCCCKRHFFLQDVDISNVLVSDEISSGKKNYTYFLGYLYDDYKIKSLHVMLAKTSTYVKSYAGQTKLMYFLNEDDNFFKKYNATWDKVRADMKKRIWWTCLQLIKKKKKVKSNGDEVTDLYDKEIPKVDSNNTCLTVMSMDSAIKKNGNYYMQVFLKDENTLKKSD